MSMFCYQCEQTARGEGCTNYGVCGKDPETAALQDLLIESAKDVSKYAHRARQLGAIDAGVDHYVMEALFTTVTNVNFDAENIVGHIRQGVGVLEKAKALYVEAAQQAGQTPETVTLPIDWSAVTDTAELIRMGENVTIEKRIHALGPDAAGLQELLTYGLKGTAAYADHAMILGKENDEVYAFFHDAMNFLTKENPTVDELLGYVLKCGEVNLKVMEMLDGIHTSTYGNPVPTPVRITPVKGKAILISGHDLKDLEELLKQTEGKGINIYTHSEMLPAHGYLGLKKYPHLVGNYGGAWQDQQKEFDAFPGAILMTTNCIQKPKASYSDRIFTCGLVRWPDVQHIENRDFSPVIDAALAAEGFQEDGEDKTILTGFGHNAVLGVADKVIDAVKSGAIKRFFLIGGCDGAKPGRNYYTDFAQEVPDNCVIMTLACGKYRFNKYDFGEIGGIPRLLDMGQCNDAYSAIKVAGALADAFECDVNDLPLSMILSWFEQKAVCILLTLLYLGIKDIRLGPSLPAFVSPAVLDVLVEKFNITPITEAKADLEACLA